MGKKLLKRMLCILLVLSLICASSFSVYLFTEHSIMYDNIVHKKMEINEENLRLVYTKERDMRILKSEIERTGYCTDINDLFYFISKKQDCILITGEYIGRNTVRNGAYLKFKVNEVLFNSGEVPVEKGEKIRYFTPNYETYNTYYAFEEVVFYAYDMEYKKGDEYILFARQYSNDEKPDKPSYGFVKAFIERGSFGDRYMFLIVNKLSGEYPSIKMFPGPVEYDATYFGAETKYVTADEFTELLKKELALRVTDASE